MTPSVRALALTVALLGWSHAGRAAASETEVREFNIEIDGKLSGQLAMTITKQDNGVLSVQSKANTSFTYLGGFKTYTYKFEGVEHWNNGRIFQLSSQCDDDGTKTTVKGDAKGDALQLTVNGRVRNCRGDIWTTTYWTLPDRQFFNNKVPLLDSDTGTEYVAHLEYKGQEKMLIGGNQQNCFHLRVTGGPTTPCDLWYDAQYRLVRQEFTDHGKRVLLTLTTQRRQN